MKTRTAIVALILAFLVLPSSILRGEEKDPGPMINHANSVILDGSSPREGVVAALVELLDASLLILPKARAQDECRSRIETVKKEFDQKSIFSDKAHQYLSLAYRLVTNGQRWELPPEMREPYRQDDIMAAAKRAGQRLVDSALTDWKAGRSEESVRSLLGYVLMVITPVESR